MGVQIRSLGIGLQRIYHGVSTKPQKSGVPIRPIPPELLRQIYENLNYRSLPWSWLVGSRALPGYLQYAHGYKTRLRVCSVLAARIKGAIKMMMNWQTVVQQWSSTCKWADKDALNVKNFPLRHHALGQCACARVSPTQCVVRCHLVKYGHGPKDRQRDGRTDCDASVSEVCGFSCVNDAHASLPHHRPAHWIIMTLSRACCEWKATL